MLLYHFLKGYKDDEKNFIGILDNQNYVFSGLTVENDRLPSRKIEFSEAPKRRTQPEHFEDRIWSFLNLIAHDIKNDHITRNHVLFNDSDYEHNTDDAFIRVTGTDAGNFTLTTGNLVGFVKRDHYFLKISSRFGDAFLKYIIADADGFLELENTGGESHDDGYEWLLAYLWNIKLKKAYRLGLPKAYITKHDRVSRVRGTIDVIDYFRNKTSGKYLCSYREHSYDNPATSLFIKAYEMVKIYSFCKQTRSIYNAFLIANQGVKRSRKEILRTPYFSNPFYSDYNVLIDLSKRVIRQQCSDFDSPHDSSAFVFDVSMLFEYFIRKLLKRNGFRLRSKSEQHYEIPTGIRSYKRKLKPDLVLESDDGIYVFDVKYKTFDQTHGVKREDLFQLHTYIGRYGNENPIKGCGFIYPISEKEWTEDLKRTQGLISDTIRQQGHNIPFHVLFLKIPDNTSTDFNRLMREQCLMFIESMMRVITGESPAAEDMK